MFRTFQKSLSIILIITVLLFLSACNSNDSNGLENTGDAVVTDEVVEAELNTEAPKERVGTSLPSWAQEYNQTQTEEPSPARERVFDTLVFSDEFDVDGTPDPQKWVHEVNGGGGGNNELQYYTDELENSYVEDGKLVIKAIKEDYRGKEYTSARLVTYGKFSFTYGRVDVSAKLPAGKGSWPAIWMLGDSIMKGTSWPLCGEIDIMEHVGKDMNRVHSTLHSDSYNHKKGTQIGKGKLLEDVSNTFHQYSCVWDEGFIAFYFDDELLVRYDKANFTDQTVKGWPFNKNFFIILNIAVGGSWGGAVDDETLPYIMEIDYVRVYQDSTDLAESGE